MKIWHDIGQFEQKIGSPSAAGPFVGGVARVKVQDRHPLSYLVRVWDEDVWAISDRSAVGYPSCRVVIPREAPLALWVDH